MGPIPLLLLVYLCTAVLACVISNTAAVVILYSIVRNLQVRAATSSATHCRARS